MDARGKFSAQKDTDWTDVHYDVLRSEFAKGQSATQIASTLAKVFGIKKSRNAVIGKLHRLGMRRNKETKAVSDRQAKKHELKMMKPIKFAPPRDPEVVISEPEGSPHKCTIYELGSHRCKWPIEETAPSVYMYCGAASVKSTPYCAHHNACSYTDRKPPPTTPSYYKRTGR